MESNNIIDLGYMLSCDESARILGCSPRTIARMCERGTLKACRAGNRWRINRDALLAYAGIEVSR